MSNNTIINMPTSGTDLIIRDLTDANGSIIVSSAVFRRDVTHTLIGFDSQIVTHESKSMKLCEGKDFDHGGTRQYISAWAVDYGEESACLVNFNKLKITTGFRALAADGATVVQLPTFNIGNIEKSMWWSCPVSLWLLVRRNEVILVAAKPDFDGALYRVPLPNIYDNGRVCMGREYEFPREEPHTVFENHLKHIIDSRWNTDLQPDMSRCEAVFRWDDQDNQIQPTADEFLGKCYRVMNNELSKLILSLNPL